MSPISNMGDVTPPACRFYRTIIADEVLLNDDIKLVARHTQDCADCENVIGQIIHDRIESNKQRDMAPGA